MSIAEILKNLCSTAYWYAEETGDYDMSQIKEKDLFKSTLLELQNYEEEKD